MFRFKPWMPKGCFIDTGDSSTGGGGEAPAPAAPAEPAAAAEPEAPAAPAEDQGISREDFRIAPMLRNRQTIPAGEPVEVVSEEGTPDNLKAEEPGEPEQKEQTPPKVKLPDGREVTPDELAAWEKGHMLQSDYTKKTQALADERRKLEEQFAPLVQRGEDHTKAMSLWDSMARDPIGVLNKLQEYYAEKGIYDAKDPEQLALEDEKRAVEQEKAQLQKDKYDQQVVTELDKLDKQFKALTDKHGDAFNQAEVARFMLDNKLTDPEKAFEAVAGPSLRENLQKQIDELQAKMKNVGSSAVNDYVKGKTNRAATPPPVGATGGGAPPVAITRPKTFQDARRAAISRFSGEGG
jgi:hypothetical protein